MKCRIKQKLRIYYLRFYCYFRRKNKKEITMNENNVSKKEIVVIDINKLLSDAFRDIPPIKEEEKNVLLQYAERGIQLLEKKHTDDIEIKKTDALQLKTEHTDKISIEKSKLKLSTQQTFISAGLSIILIAFAVIFNDNTFGIGGAITSGITAFSKIIDIIKK